jgi:DNA-directed RNA polymerase alpha subunit
MAVNDYKVSYEIIKKSFDTEVKLQTTDVKYANIFMITILSEIPTYAIEYVTFYVNDSPLYDELLAHRLGMLVIDNEKYEHGDKFKFHVDYTNTSSNNSTFTSDDIKDLIFNMKTPIIELRPNDRIKFDVEVRLGISRDHVKWRPVGPCYIKENKSENTISVIYRNIGMLSDETIVNQAFKYMTITATRPPLNIFYKHHIPAELQNLEIVIGDDETLASEIEDYLV